MTSGVSHPNLPLDSRPPAFHTEDVLQLSFKKPGDTTSTLRLREAATLVDLREGEEGVLDSLEVPPDVARRLMELGFLPGAVIVAARSAPSGDPRVFRVDGSEVALRRETAACLRLRGGKRTPANTK